MDIVSGRSFSVGQRVRVYLNLNRGKCTYSIVDVKLNRVVAYAHSVILKNALFHVGAGRNRVLREHRKNVHAWVLGEYISADCDLPETLDTEVYYNPYTTETFVALPIQTAIYEAPLACCSNRRVYVSA